MSELNIKHSEWMVKRANRLREILPPDEVYLHLLVLIDMWYERDTQLYEFDRSTFLQLVCSDQETCMISSWISEMHDDFDISCQEDS